MKYGRSMGTTADDFRWWRWYVWRWYVPAT